MREVYTDLEIKKDIIYPFPNKDTKIYGSFAKEAGNKGCEFFNNAFKKHNINAIYKSFSVNNIEEAFRAAKTLNMYGFAVAMPFKKEIVKLGGNLNPSYCKGSANTIVRDDNFAYGEYFGHNTDYIGAKQMIKKYRSYHDKVYVLGTGGLSVAVQQAVKDCGLKLVVVGRNSWDLLEDLNDAFIYNCTPLDVTYLNREYNVLLDCRIGTDTGDELYNIQARAQFKLYTGIEYSYES
jgi:shikimate 5-dehydrogenase